MRRLPIAPVDIEPGLAKSVTLTEHFVHAAQDAVADMDIAGFGGVKIACVAKIDFVSLESVIDRPRNRIRYFVARVPYGYSHSGNLSRSNNAGESLGNSKFILQNMRHLSVI